MLLHEIDMSKPNPLPYYCIVQNVSTQSNCIIQIVTHDHPEVEEEVDSKKEPVYENSESFQVDFLDIFEYGIC